MAEINHKNRKLTSISQSLRREMTKEERKLWYGFPKKLPVTVNRQKVFKNFVVDFYCASKKTAIEIDGYQHYDNDGITKDKLRDEYFASIGIKVLRYSNREVNDEFESVCNDILKNLGLL